MNEWHEILAYTWMMFSNKVVKAPDKDERSPWMKTGLIYEELNKINLSKQL